MRIWKRPPERVLAMVLPCLSALLAASVLLAGAEVARAESCQGFLEPNVQVEITSPYRTTVKKLHVQEGDEVRQNQLLAELDKGTLEAALKIAAARRDAGGKVQYARATLDLKNRRLAILRKLSRTGNATRDELQRAGAEAAMAEAALRSAIEEQQVSELEYQRIVAEIEERNIRSPIDGVVARVHKREAELVDISAEHPLLTVVQLNPLKAVFHLSPGAASDLRKGQPVALTLHGDNRPVPGTVDFISPVVEPQSGTVRVRILVDNSRGTLRSGLLCDLNPADKP